VVSGTKCYTLCMNQIAKLLSDLRTPQWLHGAKMSLLNGQPVIHLITNKKIGKKEAAEVPEEIEGTRVIIVYKNPMRYL
jgi:hypothetical protein